MHQPSPIELRHRNINISDYDQRQPELLDKSEYKKQLKHWQKRLLRVQQAYYHLGKRAIIVFEGWDCAGKGGAIRRITQKLDPRGYTVYPISAPSEEDQGKHYLYRFFTKLPKAGTVSIFDRSYYGRVLVERVEGFASDHEWQRAYQEINEFERLLIDDDLRVVKLFFHIDKDEQLQRFIRRLQDPSKRWKLTMDDVRNRQKWPEYVTAINDMLQHTDSVQAPWQIIAGHNKPYARVEVLKILVESLSRGVDIEPPPIDPGVVKVAKQKLGMVIDEG